MCERLKKSAKFWTNKSALGIRSKHMKKIAALLFVVLIGASVSAQKSQKTDVRAAEEIRKVLDEQVGAWNPIETYEKDCSAFVCSFDWSVGFSPKIAKNGCASG